jgi:hypothetical protein
MWWESVAGEIARVERASAQPKGLVDVEIRSRSLSRWGSANAFRIAVRRARDSWTVLVTGAVLTALSDEATVGFIPELHLLDGILTQ